MDFLLELKFCLVIVLVGWKHIFTSVIVIRFLWMEITGMLNYVVLTWVTNKKYTLYCVYIEDVCTLKIINLRNELKWVTQCENLASLTGVYLIDQKHSIPN